MLLFDDYRILYVSQSPPVSPLSPELSFCDGKTALSLLFGHSPSWSSRQSSLISSSSFTKGLVPRSSKIQNIVHKCYISIILYQRLNISFISNNLSDSLTASLTSFEKSLSLKCFGCLHFYWHYAGGAFNNAHG